jgi:hypothetical protein
VQGQDDWVVIAAGFLVGQGLNDKSVALLREP